MAGPAPARAASASGDPSGGAMTDRFVPRPRSARLPEEKLCQHLPRCPDALAPDRVAARPVASHPGQGWSLLCNGVVLFGDGGRVLPGCRVGSPALIWVVVGAVGPV